MLQLNVNEQISLSTRGANRARRVAKLCSKSSKFTANKVKRQKPAGRGMSVGQGGQGGQGGHR